MKMTNREAPVNAPGGPTEHYSIALIHPPKVLPLPAAQTHHSH